MKIKDKELTYEVTIVIVVLLFCIIIGSGIYRHALTLMLCLCGFGLLVALGCLLHSLNRHMDKTGNVPGFASAYIEGKEIFIEQHFDHFDNLLIDGRKEQLTDMIPARFTFKPHPDMGLENTSVYYCSRRSVAITGEVPRLVYIRQNFDSQHIRCLWYILTFSEPEDRVKSFRELMDVIEKHLMSGYRREKIEERTGCLTNVKNRKNIRKQMNEEFNRIWRSKNSIQRIMITSGVHDDDFHKFELFDMEYVEVWRQFKFYREMTDAEKKRFFGKDDIKAGMMKE